MRLLKSILFATLLSGCSEAPWLNPIDPPTHDDEAIAFSIQEIEKATNTQLDFDVEIHWLDQECIQFPDEPCDTYGFNWRSYWYPECEIWVINRGMSFADTSLVHELMHCALAEETGYPGTNHESPWFKMVKPINAELREWEIGLE